MPPLEALLGDDPLGPRARIELLRLEPGDPREPVARLPAPVRVLEVVEQRADGIGVEPERLEPSARLLARHDRTARGR